MESLPPRNYSRLNDIWQSLPDVRVRRPEPPA